MNYLTKKEDLARGLKYIDMCGLVNNKYSHVKIAAGDIYFFRIVLGCRGGFIRGPHYVDGEVSM
jgi:hypothetical protein